MNTFDVVMERAYDEKMREKMTTSYKSGQETSLDLVKKAKKSLKEARAFVQDHDIVSAKKKYQETLNLIKKAGQAVNTTWFDLNSSGSSKGYFVKILFATVAAIIFMGGGIIAGLTQNKGGAVGYVKQIGISTASIGAGLVGQQLGFKWINKDNKRNYNTFVKEINEDPKKVLSGIASIIDELYAQVKKEMESL